MAKEYRKIKIKMAQFKEESTRGTYETLGDSDTYCVHNAELPSLSPNVLEMDCSNGTLTSADDTVLVGDTEVSLSFSIAMPLSEVDSVSSYNTNYGLFWETAGFQLEEGSPNQLFITPNDQAVTSLSCAYNIDGWEYQVRGCVAEEISVNFVSKEAAMLNITLKGTLHDVLEKAEPSNASIKSLAPELTAGLSVEIDDGTNIYGALMNSNILTVSNEVIPMESITSTKGIAYYAIVGRDARIAIDASSFSYGTSQADDEVYGLFANSTKSTILVSNGSNNIVQLKGKITNFEPNDASGVLHNNVVVKATGAVSDLQINVWETT